MKTISTGANCLGGTTSSTRAQCSGEILHWGASCTPTEVALSISGQFMGSLYYTKQIIGYEELNDAVNAVKHCVSTVKGVYS